MTETEKSLVKLAGKVKRLKRDIYRMIMSKKVFVCILDKLNEIGKRVDKK